MATVDWVVPTAEQVRKFLATAIIGATNELDSGGGERVVFILGTQVERVRGAIRSADRVPVSLTPGSVPPEAVGFVLILTAAAMAASTPQLAVWADSDWFKRELDAAEDWLKAIYDGLTPSAPTDPVPPVTPGQTETDWGDRSDLVDLTTDGPTVTP